MEVKESTGLKISDIGKPLPNSFVRINGFGSDPLFLVEKWKLDSIRSSLLSNNCCNLPDLATTYSISNTKPQLGQNKRIQYSADPIGMLQTRSFSLTKDDISFPHPESFVHVSGIKFAGTDPNVGKQILRGSILDTKRFGEQMYKRAITIISQLLARVFINKVMKKRVKNNTEEIILNEDKQQ